MVSPYLHIPATYVKELTLHKYTFMVHQNNNNHLYFKIGTSGFIVHTTSEHDLRIALIYVPLELGELPNILHRKLFKMSE